MICPVCGSRLHGNVCKNCGYSIKEKSEMMLNQVDENNDADENDDEYGVKEAMQDIIFLIFFVCMMGALILYGLFE